MTPNLTFALIAITSREPYLCSKQEGKHHAPVFMTLHLLLLMCPSGRDIREIDILCLQNFVKERVDIFSWGTWAVYWETIILKWLRITWCKDVHRTEQFPGLVPVFVANSTKTMFRFHKGKEYSYQLTVRIDLNTSCFSVCVQMLDSVYVTFMSCRLVSSSP